MSLVTFVIRRTKWPEYVAYDGGTLFLLIRDKHGDDLLNNAKPMVLTTALMPTSSLTIYEETDTYSFTTSLPENRPFYLTVFTAVQVCENGSTQFSLLTREHNARTIQLHSGTQTVDLGFYGDPPKRDSLMRNLELCDDVAVLWTFSNCPKRFAMPRNAEECADVPHLAIKLVSTQGATSVDFLASDPLGMREGNLVADLSFVCIQARCFLSKIPNLRIGCEIQDTTTNLTVGEFCLDLESLYQSERPNGVVHVSLENSQAYRQVTASYVYITPYPKNDRQRLPVADMHQFWRSPRQLLGGHRGSGNSFTAERQSEIRENTFESFAAVEQIRGADFVEFDVALSWDRIPIVYHDLSLYVDGRHRHLHTMTYAEIDDATRANPTRAHNVSQRGGPLNKVKELEFDASRSWVLPKLLDLYKSDKLTAKIAFNIEVKWPNMEEDGSAEAGMEENWVDLNRYVDTIINTVEQGLQLRKHNAIFSCFSPHVCAALKLKQSRHPVLFLTQGTTRFWQDLMDVRTRKNQNPLKYAKFMDLFGINVLVEKHSREEIEAYTEQCHQNGVRIHCYGDHMQELDFLEMMKRSAVDGLCYDCIHRDVACSKLSIT